MTVPTWVGEIERGSFVVYRGTTYRTWMVTEHFFRVGVRIPERVDDSAFDPRDVVLLDSAPRPRWVLLRPDALDSSFVSLTTARWRGARVWLAGQPDLDHGTVLVGSRDEFDEQVRSSRHVQGRSSTGWFTMAALSELEDVTVERTPRVILPMPERR